MSRINFGLEELQAFVAVADRSSFRMAAEHLYISQPALSRRIDKLEAALGLRLLERTTRQVDLTAAGRQFLERARQALEDLEDAVTRLSDDAQARRGQVTVACVPSVAQHVLPGIAKAFAQKQPHVRLRVIDDSAHRVLASVVSGEADFGLNFTGAQEPDVEFEVLGRDDYALVLPHDHPLATRAGVAWADLADQKMVAVSRQSANRLLVDHALAALPRRPVWFYETEHVAGALGLVSAGLGLAALPRLSVPPDHPSLRCVPLVEPVVSRVVGLVTRRGRTLSPTACQLCELVRRDFGAEAGGCSSRAGG
ncbi:LysR family transcriptional regulator [Azohydromonas caseinilytica]|uniref:LysR family transcriptional regulator n=1 Tax=Azohydromonas caseinilytica TaxID=2728836 RepID=A0A848FG48_9BURK|nr:LysR family transcriptional regulator [Azohydromonas caseinilytica]NML18242.1 LysR family transcriptional regulator [Azohydromonas caseinilytica]